MVAERALITRLESANVRELVDLLSDHDPLVQAALRSYYGPDLHKRLSALAFGAIPQYEHGTHGKDNVVFIHDFFGGALSAINRDKSGDKSELLWMSADKLVDGVLGRLRLKEDGITAIREEDRIRATGVLKLHYSEILLTLAQHYNVFAFAYDWRKHPRLAATDLDAVMTTWVGHEGDFHIVTHGSGSLVARAYMQQFRSSGASEDHGPGRRRIFMIAPLHHGTFFAAQMLAGVADVERSLAALDLRHSPSEVAEIFRSFPGLYMLLPAPHDANDVEILKLYETATYGNAEIPSHHLDAARSFHQSMHNKPYERRMFIVLGIGQPTATKLKSANGLRDVSPDDPDKSDALFENTFLGDGIVDAERGRIGEAKTRYLEAQHGALPSHPAVLEALHPFLANGAIPDPTVDTRWFATPSPRAPQKQEDPKARVRKMEDRRERNETRARLLSQRDISSSPDMVFTPDEHLIMRGALAPLLAPRAASEAKSASAESTSDPEPEMPKVEIDVRRGSIATDCDSRSATPIDAIAIGHYRGAPVGGVLSALDNELDKVLGQGHVSSAGRGPIGTLLSRGIAGQDIGQVFCLPDPRPSKVPRLIMIAGMGTIGKFGGPEAARLAHEVVSTAALLGKRHLAMTLIGSGTGNLPIREAVSRILQGVKDAFRVHGEQTLERITFFELDEARMADLEDALELEKRILADRSRLDIQLRKKRSVQNDALTNPLEGSTKPETTKPEPSVASDEQAFDNATRIIINREDDTYTFGAMTKNASIPEREMRADTRLVDEANDCLVNATTLAEQREWGLMLGKLLLPPSFRSEIFAGQSVVFLVNDQAARIHWEMIADVDWCQQSDNQEDTELRKDPTKTFEETDTGVFLGMGRGLTRQLCTKFAPPPQPFVPSARKLRVLVIADPALDAQLPGAKLEGAAVEALFRRYAELRLTGEVENRVQVEHLFGAEATRAMVLKKLMNTTFDVLHYAGHCGLGPDGQYGWLFNKKDQVFISRDELRALERVPSFVFANACQSGLTAGRADRRSADMAPNFAETFFQCGVANFVCTAWPIDDKAARIFALTFYAALLGLRPPGKQEKGTGNRARDAFDVSNYVRQEGGPETIQMAMQKARASIAGTLRALSDGTDDDALEGEETGEDARTWGAYQHYGDPAFRLFR